MLRMGISSRLHLSLITGTTETAPSVTQELQVGGGSCSIYHL